MGVTEIVAVTGVVPVFTAANAEIFPVPLPAKPIEVDWRDRPPSPAWNWWRPVGGELVTQWRTSPAVVDWNADKINDLLIVDHEGYLAMFPRQRSGSSLSLLPGKRDFLGQTYGPRHVVVSNQIAPLRLNAETAGRSGRRKFCLADWDDDGRTDLLVDSENVSFLRNTPTAGSPSTVTFVDHGPVSKQRLAGHTTSPTTVDWDGDSIRDLLVGGEDGYLYYLRNPQSKDPNNSIQP